MDATAPSVGTSTRGGGDQERWASNALPGNGRASGYCLTIESDGRRYLSGIHDRKDLAEFRRIGVYLWIRENMYLASQLRQLLRAGSESDVRVILDLLKFVIGSMFTFSNVRSRNPC